jgi:NAD(P)-dependent dehydrogenase (short-subunit alcohol dehydrogenase family)
MQISGKTFLIAGASSGLGKATVSRLVAAGANVIAADLTAEAGEKLVRELGDRARFVRADVTDEDQMRAAVSVDTDAFGGLQGVINCAGIAIAAKVYSSRGIHALEAFDKVIQVNLVGSFNVIRLAAEAMVAGEPNEAGERGIIINTASVAALMGRLARRPTPRLKDGSSA